MQLLFFVKIAVSVIMFFATDACAHVDILFSSVGTT